MAKIKLADDAETIWRECLLSAADKCHYAMPSWYLNYLVALLIRFTSDQNLLASVVAIDFLVGMQANTALKKEYLREVGDKCLLLSGFFPKIATKRLVEVDYFIKIGQSAYSEVAVCSHSLYTKLAKHFVILVNILQTVKKSEASFIVGDVLESSQHVIQKDAIIIPTNNFH